MLITEDYKRLMQYDELPERFRAGDFVITEHEEKVMREFVDNFYASVEKSGFVTLEDFAELMDFMRIARDADTEEVQKIITEVYLKCTEIHNRLHQ